MDSERAEWVLLGALLIYLRLMHNEYGGIPRFFGAIEMWWNSAFAFYWPFLDQGKEQRLVAANITWVFPECDASSPPSFLISVLLQVRGTSSMYAQAHAHLGQSSNTAMVFTCLYISIKIGVRHLC